MLTTTKCSNLSQPMRRSSVLLVCATSYWTLIYDSADDLVKARVEANVIDPGRHSRKTFVAIVVKLSLFLVLRGQTRDLFQGLWPFLLGFEILMVIPTKLLQLIRRHGRLQKMDRS